MKEMLQEVMLIQYKSLKSKIMDNSKTIRDAGPERSKNEAEVAGAKRAPETIRTVGARTLRTARTAEIVRLLTAVLTAVLIAAFTLVPFAQIFSFGTVSAQNISIEKPTASDEYTEDVIKGDYIIEEYIRKNDTWYIRIEGINADRFIENLMTDNALDYILDLRDAPSSTKHIVISISDRVFDAMHQLKENLIILNPVNQIIIRPGIFSGVNCQGVNGYNRLNQFYNFNYEITITLNDVISMKNIEGVKFKTQAASLKIETRKGHLFNPVSKLGNPLQIIYLYNDRDWNVPGVTTGLIFDTKLSSWKKADALAEFDLDINKGFLIFEMPITGGMAVADYTKDEYDNISASIYREAINNVASVHELKSIEGNIFRASKDISIEDAVKLILDVMDYQYENGYLTAAIRAGIIEKNSADMQDKDCTREKALYMAIRLYELKAGEKAGPRGNAKYPFEDIGKVSPQYLDNVKFAIENGFLSYIHGNMLKPDDIIMKGEFMAIIEKVLKAVGEL
ncbi:MAG TPA: S-layer homology domain-containing protein [Clostridiales bacterium]|nr:S-layer homology domain-containing protein [Clostridiales bacterium]